MRGVLQACLSGSNDLGSGFKTAVLRLQRLHRNTLRESEENVRCWVRFASVSAVHKPA